jgi:RNA polymerase-binding transcription factor DksA
MADYTKVRGQLEKRLADLGARAARIEDDLAEPMSADSGERAVEAEDDDALQGQDAAIHREMDATVSAIRRIDLGTYGACTSCGGMIGPARLAVMPTTALCIDCARAAQG